MIFPSPNLSSSLHKLARIPVLNMTKIAHHHRVPQTVHLTAQQTSWLLPPRPSPALDELHRRANPYYNAPAKSHRPQPADFSLLSPPTDIRLTAFVSDIDAGRRSSYAYVVGYSRVHGHSSQAPATKPETFTTAKPLPNRLKAGAIKPPTISTKKTNAEAPIVLLSKEEVAAIVTRKAAASTNPIPITDSIHQDVPIKNTVLPTPPETPTSPTASQILDHPTPDAPETRPFSPCKTVKTPSSVLLRASTNPQIISESKAQSIRFASSTLCPPRKEAPVLEAPIKMSYAEALRSSTSTAVASGRPSMLTRNI
ncbi:hypothetical protein BC829DRAFT_384792 [Chytridium lagenaria]|nr:hypothetical protein BC829DRAFT_384792 [Chytridium lagenaria]